MKIFKSQQSGWVLIICLAFLSLLSVYAMSAMQQAGLLAKQLGAYQQQNSLQAIKPLSINRAIELIQEKPIATWPTDNVDVNNKQAWQVASLNTKRATPITSSFYVQYLGIFKNKAFSPMLNQRTSSKVDAVSHLFRVTALVEHSVYSQFMQFDYIKVVYE